MNLKTQEFQDTQGKIKNGQIESCHDQHLQEPSQEEQMLLFSVINYSILPHSIYGLKKTCSFPCDIAKVYSGTSLIRTSLNRNLANPNGNALVNFFYFNFLIFFVVVAILTSFFLYSDGACPSFTPSLAADSTFLTCMNKDVSIHAKLLLTI